MFEYIDYADLQTDYLYESLDLFKLDVIEFVNIRLKKKPKLVLLSFNKEFENYCAKCKIYRYGDPTNVLKIVYTYNYTDNEMNTFLVFHDLRWKIDNNWFHYVSNFFDSTILPNYFGFHPNNFRTYDELNKGASNELKEVHGLKMMDLWDFLKYEPKKITSIKEVNNSSYVKERQVKKLFDLCYYQLSTNEIKLINFYLNQTT